MRFSDRPLIITVAPSPTRVELIARPMPAVEPVTSASLFSSWRFMIELFCRPAAVHGERLARDERRLVRTEPQHCFGDFLGPACAPNRVHGRKLAVSVSSDSTGEAVEHRGFNAPWRNGVHTDAFRGVFESRGFRQANHCVLAGNVNARARKTNQSADRGIVHDHTAAILQHGRNLVL